MLENAVPELVKGKSLSPSLFQQAMGRRAEWIEPGKHEDWAERVITEDQIRGLPAELVAFGSHAVTHTPLSRMDEKDLKKDLSNPRRRSKE